MMRLVMVEAFDEGQTVSVSAPIKDWKAGEWHHVAATYDGTLWHLYVDGRLVANVADLSGNESAIIEPLKVALMSQSDRILKDAAGNEMAHREVTIMGDKTVPYSLLKKVMATCTTADFGKVSLAVLEKGRMVGA